MFKRIFENMKNFLKKLFGKDQVREREQSETTPNDSLQSDTQGIKTFRVIGEKKIEKPVFPAEAKTEKTFKIKGEQEIESNPNPVGKFDDSEGSFRISSQTRPKKCEQCLTENKITRLKSGKWKCTECGYTWR